MGNIRRNAAFFKAQSGVKLCAVVKADGYGHGGEEVTSALLGVADAFAVATVEEGIAVRLAACGRDILVLAPPWDEETAYALAANDLIVSVPSLTSARLVAETARKYRLTARVHLKVNTGMNRYGMNANMLGRVCRFLSKTPWVRVEGVYSHLYREDEETANGQREKFLAAERVAKGYFPQAIAHLSATYGVGLGKAFAFDMVRVGLGLYGYAPAPLPLERGMEVWAKVADARVYRYGGVGYGEPPPVKRGEGLSVLRYGYADGFLRGSGELNALCMDASFVRGRYVRGRELPVMTDAEQTAKEWGTIPYEVLCRATYRAERIYDLR